MVLPVGHASPDGRPGGMKSNGPLVDNGSPNGSPSGHRSMKSNDSLVGSGSPDGRPFWPRAMKSNDSLVGNGRHDGSSSGSRAMRSNDSLFGNGRPDGSSSSPRAMKSNDSLVGNGSPDCSPSCPRATKSNDLLFGKCSPDGRPSRRRAVDFKSDPRPLSCNRFTEIVNLLQNSIGKPRCLKHCFGSTCVHNIIHFVWQCNSGRNRMGVNQVSQKSVHSWCGFVRPAFNLIRRSFKGKRV